MPNRSKPKSQRKNKRDGTLVIGLKGPPSPLQHWRAVTILAREVGDCIFDHEVTACEGGCTYVMTYTKMGK